MQELKLSITLDIFEDLFIICRFYGPKRTKFCTGGEIWTPEQKEKINRTVDARKKKKV